MARPAPRRPALDWLLLIGLGGVFLAVLGLHVAKLGTIGGTRPPVYVVPQAGSLYPMVGGPREGSDTELRRGDRILEVAGQDLAGAGYFRFDATVLEAATRDRDVSVVYERHGERRETRFRIEPRGLASFRLPALISFALVATLVLLRSPGTTESRALYVAFMGLAIFEMPFAGSAWSTYAYYAVFYGVGQLTVLWLLRLAVHFPREVPEEKRASRHWVWLGLVFWICRIPYVTGLGLPPTWLPTWTIVGDVVLFTAGTAIFLHNVRHAEPLGRRRAKWVLLGFLVPVVPMVLALSSSALDLPPRAYQALFQTAALLGTAMPLGILVSIQREGLLDIDRVLPAAASYTLALIAAVGAGFAAVPLLGGAVARGLGVAQSSAHLAVALGLACVAVPLGARLRPLFEGFFFPERASIERGFGALLRDLSDCATREDVLDLLQQRIRDLLRLEHVTPFTPGAASFDAAPGVAAAFPAGGALVRALERDPVPLQPDARTLRARVPDLSPEDRRTLQQLDARMLLPVRRGKDLSAFLVLGPKISGDLFPATEHTLLGAAAEKASAELLRLRESASARSERRRADELRALKEAAEAANQAKTRFLAAASHDLRQPLHALLLFVHRLAERSAEGEEAGAQRELIGQIERSTRALARQFDTLLDLSRLEAGAVQPEPRACEIGPELARLAGEWSEAAGAKGLALRFDPVEATVTSDPILLGRIVSNLLSNAVRYTQQGEVHLRTARRPGQLAIEVADTGPGIPASLQREVFGEFVQLGPHGRGEGLGLGLSIVERTARLLGHEVEVESEEGRGSVFRVWVPCLSGGSDDAPSPQPQRAAPRGPDLGSARILLVDDDPSVVEAMSGLLGSWGCDVIEASGLGEALQALPETPGAADGPSLIVADYRLGEDANGMQVIRAVRERMGRAVPAVIVSGESQLDVVAELRESGTHYLAKPVSPAKLRALLSELLRGAEEVARH